MRGGVRGSFWLCASRWRGLRPYHGRVRLGHIEVKRTIAPIPAPSCAVPSLLDPGRFASFPTTHAPSISCTDFRSPPYPSPSDIGLHRQSIASATRCPSSGYAATPPSHTPVPIEPHIRLWHDLLEPHVLDRHQVQSTELPGQAPQTILRRRVVHIQSVHAQDAISKLTCWTSSGVISSNFSSAPRQ